MRYEEEKGNYVERINGEIIPHSSHDDNDLLIDEPEEVQTMVLIWINWCITPRETVNHKMSSYGLKHCLERMTGIYLTNNQFKHAMLMCGYRPESYNALNWYFSISSNSVCFSSHNKTGFKEIIRDKLYKLGGVYDEA